MNVKITSKLCLLALVACLALAHCSAAPAAVITDLFNTGVDSFGNALPNLAVDGHYTITSPAQSAVVPSGIPGSWVPDNANSRWIYPANTPFGLGAYTYETTFTLPATADPTTVVINGLWGTDNQGTDILVNGTSTGQTNVLQFTALTPFTLDNSNSTFVTGLNVIEFQLTNVSSITGFRVDEIQGNYVPEPSGGLLLGSLALLGLRLRGRA